MRCGFRVHVTILGESMAGRTTFAETPPFAGLTLGDAIRLHAIFHVFRSANRRGPTARLRAPWPLAMRQFAVWRVSKGSKPVCYFVTATSAFAGCGQGLSCRHAGYGPSDGCGHAE